MSTAAQVIYDTVRTVVYDTVHTSVFDTVHSVSYDTVKVVLDSTFTIDLLNKSQEFYSCAFGDLISVFVWVSSLFTVAIGSVFAYKVYVSKTEIDKAVKEANKRADEEVEKRIDGISKSVVNLRESVFTNFFALVRQCEYDFKTRVSLLTFVLSEISLNFDKKFLVHAFTSIEILSEIIDEAVKMGASKTVVSSIFTYVNSIEKFAKNVHISSDSKEAKEELENVERTLSAIEKIKPILKAYTDNH